MAKWSTTITNKGNALEAKQATGTALSFTRIVSGSGTVPVVKLKEQTAVSGIKQTLTVETINVRDKNYVITVLLSNNDLTTGYNLSQIGFYATDPDDGEILFAIAQIDEAKAIPSKTDSAGYNLEFAFTFKNDNNATIDITPDISGLMTRAGVEGVIEEELGNVDNTSDMDKPVSTAQATAIADAKKAGTTAQSNLEAHTGNKQNPHGVTKSQVGLGNVPNVSTNDQTPSYTESTTLSKLSSGEKLSVAFGKLSKAVTDLISHIGNKNNPHSVTKSQIGLGNVENKSSAIIRDELTKGNVTNALGYTPLDSAKKGSANGVAELDSNGMVPSSQLPSYVDDVLEGTATGTSIDATTKAVSATGFILTGQSTACTPESGKIYLDTTSNIQFRWSGSKFISTGSFLALGETSSTAYRGDRGKAAYDHSQKTSGNPHGVTKSDVGLGNVNNTADLDKPISTAQQEAFDEINRNLDELESNLCTNMLKPVLQSCTIKDIGITLNSDGTYTLNGTATSDTIIDVTLQAKITGDGKLKRNLIKISGDYSGTIKHLSFASSWTYGSEYDIGTPQLLTKDIKFSFFRIIVKSGTSCNNLKVGYVVNDNPTKYVAYTGETGSLNSDVANINYSIDAQNASLVEQKMLGWNVPAECPVQNIVSNEVFTQKVGRVDLGNLDWSYSSEYKRFSTSGITDYKKKDSSTNTWVADAFLKGYSTTSGNNTASDSYNKSIGFNGTSNMFFVKNTSYTDTTTFKNAMQGKYLYYELETEITMNVDGNEAVDRIKNDLGEQKKIYSESTINVGRQAGTTVGDNSTAEGADTEASGASSHSEGWLTTASNDCSHAEGNQTGASGIASHSEGTATGASGDYSHAEGDTTTASGESSHAEGFNTTASGNYSHAEGNETTATSSCSHAEGYKTKAYSNSHAEGYNTTANNYSHAECYETTANGTGSHAEGNNTTAKGNYSHSEGNGTEASGSSSHSEGSWTTASGDYSHAEGNETTALRNQHAQGHYNNTSTATANSTNGTSIGTAFVIGNGTSSSKSNAFRVTGEGKVFGSGDYNSSGADYAEFEEWADGNPNNEDRVGYFVTYDENSKKKIRIANAGDWILGVYSGSPCIIGNSDEDWMQRYILDDFGRKIEETFEYEETVINEETGEETTITKIGTKWKENPDYDSSRQYVQRSERKEWATIGWMGVISVRDDGTCKQNGFCKVADGGIATEAMPEEGSYLTPIYRVIDRVTDNVVRVVIRF